MRHKDVTQSKFVNEPSQREPDLYPAPRPRPRRATGGPSRAFAQRAERHGYRRAAPAGVEDSHEAKWAVNAASFAAYLDRVLSPTLMPGDVVILNSLCVHKTPSLAELVESRRARPLFFSPYLPDFTPVELAFGKPKTYLRTVTARTREALTGEVRSGLDWVTTRHAQFWIHYRGYHAY